MGLVALGALLGMPASALLLATLVGCGDDDIQLPPLQPEYEAGVFVPDLPDGAVECRADDECDDGIECTRDECDPLLHFCEHGTDSAMCSDGVFCNGPEQCEPTKGCVPGLPLRCDDGDLCTVDTCDEKQKRCVNDPRDFDGDGEVDWHCFGGTDCDDFDVTRANAASEICGDGADNDCDDLVDETGCGAPEHDTCGGALDVSVGGRFAVGLQGANPDYGLGCGVVGARDVVFQFTTDGPRDVTLVANGVLSDGNDETAVLALRGRCEDLHTEIECSSGFPGQVRVRALAAGTYFVIAASERSVQIVLDVRLDPPTDAPSNLSCDTPLDVSGGGHVAGSLVDVGDDEQISCGFANAADLMYSFTIDEEQDVEISAISVTGERMNFAVRTACSDPASTVRCVSDAPARARLHQVPAGTYYVILESSASHEVDFSFDIAFVPPTPSPPGDGCGQPIDLTLGETIDGTLAGREDLINVVCGCSPDQFELGQSCGLFLPDAVYKLTVPNATDLGVHVSGGTSSVMTYDFRTLCDLDSSQLACSRGRPLDARVRNVAPGDYFLVVESQAQTNFTLQVEQLPLTVPVDVADNDDCETAAEIPETGGLFHGDTLPLLNQYDAVCGGGARSHDAAFKMVLSTPHHVTAALQGVFDTVLYRYEDDGTGPTSCMPRLERMCNDDAGPGNSTSLLDEDLDAGTYYYIVDGFNQGNDGRYVLEVTSTAR
jgi:hypothetical protein